MLFQQFWALALFAASVSAGVVPTYPAAPLGYAAPIAKISAPLPYAAPPLTYAAPVARYAAPAAYAAPYAKLAAPVAYAAAPYAKAVVPAAVDTDYDPNPSYSYAYDIQDALTGDSKSQHESRQGDTVQGSYSLVEPDGTRRTVEYTADPHNGFNAVVHREPAVQKAVVAAHAPVAYAAAPVAKYAAPLAYAAPVAKTYAAPLAYSAYH